MENWPKNIMTNFYLGSACKINNSTHAKASFQNFNNQEINENEHIKLHFQVVDSQVEEVLDVLVEKLPLSAKLLDEYLPVLLREGFNQLNVAQIVLLGGVSFYDSHELTDNGFMQEILKQMRLLAKDCPVALLVWLVVLCRFTQLISHTNDFDQCDSICNIWKGMAANWVDKTFDSNKVGYYLIWFSTLLLKS